MEVTDKEEQPAAERHRQLNLFWRSVALVAAVLTIVLAVDQVRLIFGMQWLGDIIRLSNHYLYAILGLLLPLTFIFFPASGKVRDTGVPWYDALLCAATFGTCLFFFLNSTVIVDQGWEFVAPDYAIYVSYVLWALTLEAVRFVPVA